MISYTYKKFRKFQVYVYDKCYLKHKEVHNLILFIYLFQISFLVCP